VNTYDRTGHQVLAALNHATYTFNTFDAADWRAMAEECQRRADRLTCVDCGRDMSIVKIGQTPDPTRKHRLKGDRWSCGKP
jgi:hypothetical protein